MEQAAPAPLHFHYFCFLSLVALEFQVPTLGFISIPSMIEALGDLASVR